jgi:hypothetical protein
MRRANFAPYFESRVFMGEKRKSTRLESKRYCLLIRKSQEDKKMKDKEEELSNQSAEKDTQSKKSRKSDEEDNLEEILKSAANSAGLNLRNLDEIFQSRSTRPGKYDHIMTNLTSPNKTECMLALQELSEILSIATGLLQ